MTIIETTNNDQGNVFRIAFFALHFSHRIALVLSYCGFDSASPIKNQVEVKFVWEISYPSANGASLGIYVTGGMFEANGTASAPKSVPR